MRFVGGFPVVRKNCAPLPGSAANNCSSSAASQVGVGLCLCPPNFTFDTQAKIPGCAACRRRNLCAAWLPPQAVAQAMASIMENRGGDSEVRRMRLSANNCFNSFMVLGRVRDTCRVAKAAQSDNHFSLAMSTSRILERSHALQRRSISPFAHHPLHPAPWNPRLPQRPPPDSQLTAPLAMS